MAKDPAILWYWNDWHGGTVTFTRHLKGCYMDLLHAQFNNGRLSIEEIKNVLGNDFASWGVLSKKFKKDSADKFYNERIEFEKLKRENFSEKQRNNRLGKTKSKPNQNLLENENENINKELIKKKVDEILSSEAWIESVSINHKQGYDVLVTRLDGFLKDQKDKEEIQHRSVKEIKSHFINWLKIQIEKENKQVKNGKSVSKVEGYKSTFQSILDKRGLNTDGSVKQVDNC